MQNRLRVVAGLALLAGALSFGRPAAGGPRPQTEPLAASLPLFFTENVGQFEGPALFRGATTGATVELAPGVVTYTFRRPLGRDAGQAGLETPAFETLAVRATLAGADPAAPILGEDPAPHRSHFYLGSDPSRWRTDVRNYGAVRLRGVYPGIDLVYHGTDRRLEYDFHLAPGADPRQIRIHYDGVSKLALGQGGALAVTTRFGTMTELAPVAWQEVGGERRPVRARYTLLAANTFGFRIDGRLDPAAPLVIDPVLNYSTYLGGNSYDESHDIAYDSGGDAWVVGGTLSPNYPATGTPIPSADYVVFISRFVSNGTSLAYSVFLGGSLNQIGYGIDVDASGNAYVSGTTNSSDFPTTAGCYDNTFSGPNSGYGNIFVTKLSPTGALLYSTYLGGSGSDFNVRLALGPANVAYVLGNSASTDYPTTTGCYDATSNGLNDMVLSVINPAGGGASDLVYSTYLGGNDYEEGHDLHVTAGIGLAFIAGATRSNNFPATGGPPFNGTFDAVVACISPLGNSSSDLLSAVKIGGVGQDYAMGIATNFSFEFLVDGVTTSANFPTTAGAFQTTYGGGPEDGFVTRMSLGGILQYSTFLGGTGDDRCDELALDPAANVVAIGSTTSPAFPTTGGAYDTSHNGGADLFISGLSSTGSLLLTSTFLGGSQDDYPSGFKIDPAGNWYVTGTTASPNYPTTGGAFDTSYEGAPIDVVVTKFKPNPPEVCAMCVVPADTCCTHLPQFEFPGAPSFSPHILVGTREADIANGYPYGVTIYDLGSPPSGEDNNWAAITRFNGPGNSWKQDSLGTVFGLTLDEYGNIFVTHTSCYTTDQIAGIANGGPGAVYKIDGLTGAMSTFCRLPNYPDPNVPTGDNLPGLGNITYDCRHKQFFVTDLEDGRIYRIGPTGTILSTFDPGVADLGPTNYLTPINQVPSPGWPAMGERLWGVQWHGNRVYYSVWVEDSSWPNAYAANEIRSVGLLPNGAFNPSSDQHEIFLPSLSGYAWSFPIADISFNANGRMLLGERGIQGTTYSSPHNARVLEYTCQMGCWQPASNITIGDCCGQMNSEGGVDYDRFPYSGGALGRMWASGDALHLFGNYTDAVYGYQGLRPTGGSITTSFLIDTDGNVNGASDKSYVGDVEVPGCFNPAAGQICGVKFFDVNHNGVKDNNEPPLGGWTIQLIGSGGTFTATTDAQGNYCFNDVPPGNYSLSEVGQSAWVQTYPAGGTYPITIAAGQYIGNRDFGNWPMGPASPCVPPPPGMGAWWPFDENTGATSVADVTHPNPARNGALLFGGAAINLSGRVGHALCFGGTADYARVPNATQLGINFGVDSYAMDAWVNVAASVGGPRMIAEKRVLISSSPYRTRGWAVYLVGQQLFLEHGIGISTQIFPGPTIAGSTWTHFAVSYDRPTVQGRWYLNGVLAPSFNFSPAVGGVQSNADVYLGKPSPPFGAGVALEGCIDELELFSTSLTAQSVAALYAAGASGKCREYCRVPQVTTICKDKTSVSVCLNICNSLTTPQTYHWSLAGLPAGAGCTVNGPTLFSPPSGVVTVPAGSCSVPICVTIQRPAGLTAQNATACYALSFVNDATGFNQTCTGTIRADNSCWCVTPQQTGIVTVARSFTGSGQPVVIGIKNPCDHTGVLDYSLSAVYEPSSHPDPHAVSLNGLLPGEPVTGTLSLGPNQETNVSVGVSYPREYDPAGFYQIVLSADTDGDGVMEECAATCIASTYEDGTSGAPVEPGVPDALQLLATPNPFQTGATIVFALPVADDVDLSIFDLSGRRVRSLSHGRLAAGPQSIAWDGRDDTGRETAGGIYFVRLRSERVRVQAKVVKLR